jgi:hypothetical protein
MSTPLSGVAGKVVSGSTDMDVSGWSGEFEVDTFDSTTTADAGWESTTAAAKKVSGSFECFYTLAKKPTGATAGLTPGSTVTLRLDATSGESYTGSALITKLSVKSKAKESVTFTASFKNVGAWTYPS